MPTAPAQFISDQIGNADDTVDIQLGSDDPIMARNWVIEEKVLSQPATWTIDIGHGSNALVFFARYKPGTPFTLRVAGNPQLSGVTDRRRIAGKRGNAGTSLVISGRDVTAPLFNAHVEADKSFQNTTYANMTRRALTEAGLEPNKLVLSNTANRNLKAGYPITETQPPVTVDGNQTVPDTVGASAAQLQARFGERWLEFLRRHFDRAGLMLWGGADGSFILTAPNASLQPTYELYRNLDKRNTNVLDWEVDDDTTNRFASVRVAGRGGGRAFGTVKAIGTYADEEMASYGFAQAFTVRDVNTQTADQAGYLARRKIAEARREGWRVSYTVPGHTLPIVGTNGQARAIITVDTTIKIVDELAGIEGTFYIEAIRRERAPQTQTTMRLMRPQDVVFGDMAKAASPAVQPVLVATGKPKEPDRPFYPSGPPPAELAPKGPPPPGAVSQDANGNWLNAQNQVIPPVAPFL
jgi:prophage tail gpP-like protein